MSQANVFSDFLDHKIPEVKNATPTLSDWADHLTTLFPEVRLKQFLEMRGADGGSWRRICALPALWAGILYDISALDAAWDLVKDWTAEEREAMRQAMPKLGFKTPFRNTNVGALARRMMEIATTGLHGRAAMDSSGSTEEGFIQPLWEIVDRGQTRAEELLHRYSTEWKGDLAPLFKEYNFL